MIQVIDKNTKKVMAVIPDDDENIPALKKSKKYILKEVKIKKGK